MKVFGVSALLLTIFIMSQTINTTQGFDVPIPCTNDDACRRLQFLPSSAICASGFCVCNEGGVMRNCTPPETMLVSTKTSGPIIGRPCKQAVECRIENGFCNTTVSQCLCRHKFVSNIDNNKCLPVVSSIGARCEDNKQCLYSFPHTTCSQSQCVCIEDYHHAENVCYKNIGIGETCEKIQECSHINHAECNKQNVCACSFNTIFDSDSKHCVPHARELSHQPCTDSKQCVPTLGTNAQCIENVCQCASSAHFVSRISKCVDNKHVDESCESDDNCYQDELSATSMIMKCVNNICMCADGFFKNGDKCIFTTGSATISTMSVGLFILTLLILRP